MSRNKTFAGLLSATLLVVFCGVLSAQEHAEEFGKPREADRQVSRIVANLMQRDHLSSRPLDDMISKRSFDQYIKLSLIHI